LYYAGGILILPVQCAVSWHQGQLTKLIPLLIEIANSSSGPIQEDCVHHHANSIRWLCAHLVSSL